MPLADSPSVREFSSDVKLTQFLFKFWVYAIRTKWSVWWEFYPKVSASICIFVTSRSPMIKTILLSRTFHTGGICLISHICKSEKQQCKEKDFDYFRKLLILTATWSSEALFAFVCTYSWVFSLPTWLKPVGSHEDAGSNPFVSHILL